jgi:hypothetical protein
VSDIPFPATTILIRSRRQTTKEYFVATNVVRRNSLKILEYPYFTGRSRNLPLLEVVLNMTRYFAHSNYAKGTKPCLEIGVRSWTITPSWCNLTKRGFEMTSIQTCMRNLLSPQISFVVCIAGNPDSIELATALIFSLVLLHQARFAKQAIRGLGDTSVIRICQNRDRHKNRIATIE